MSIEPQRQFNFNTNHRPSSPERKAAKNDSYAIRRSQPHHVSPEYQLPSCYLLRQPTRHRSSLEHVFHFTLVTPQSSREQAAEAHFLYHQIVNNCEVAGLFLPIPNYTDSEGSVAKVYLHDLFRATSVLPHGPRPTEPRSDDPVWPFSPDATRNDDRLLDSIFSLAHKWLNASVPERERIHNTLQAIALDFSDGFFVPLTAQSSCTHRLSNALTPPSASNISPSQGTPVRLGGLRRLCLLPDANQCVSGQLDSQAYQQARKLGHRQILLPTLSCSRLRSTANSAGCVATLTVSPGAHTPTSLRRRATRSRSCPGCIRPRAVSRSTITSLVGSSSPTSRVRGCCACMLHAVR